MLKKYAPHEKHHDLGWFLVNINEKKITKHNKKSCMLSKIPFYKFQFEMFVFIKLYPSLAECDTRSIFKWNKASLNSEIFFS